MIRFVAAFLACSAIAGAAPIIGSSLRASLDTGSLAGISFPVSFSYDAGQVRPVGDSFINLISFDFVLLGVPFNRSEIFQGGQVIFRDGRLDNITASYQVFLPPISPVENITFGFGGPGVIGYIDLKRQSGIGSFAFASVPEPSFGVTAGIIAMVIIAIATRVRPQPLI